MRKMLLSLVGISAMLAALPVSRPVGATAFAATASPSVTPNPVFSSILATLRSDTKVPIFLPQVLPSSAGVLFADILSASAATYLVEIATSENCNTVHACTYGFISGDASSNAPPLSGTKTMLLNDAAKRNAGILYASDMWGRRMYQLNTYVRYFRESVRGRHERGEVKRSA